jgi:hypothetical protein
VRRELVLRVLERCQENFHNVMTFFLDGFLPGKPIILPGEKAQRVARPESVARNCGAGRSEPRGNRLPQIGDGCGV